MLQKISIMPLQPTTFSLMYEKLSEFVANVKQVLYIKE